MTVKRGRVFPAVALHSARADRRRSTRQGSWWPCCFSLETAVLGATPLPVTHVRNGHRVTVSGAQAQLPCAVHIERRTPSSSSRPLLQREILTPQSLPGTDHCDREALRGGARGEASGGTSGLHPHGAGCARCCPQPVSRARCSPTRSSAPTFPSP